MNKTPVFPPRLQRGDTIGLFCPAGPVRDQDRLRNGMQRIRDLGFATIVQGPTTAASGYLAGTDEQRAANLHALWQNEQVKAIWAIRGGFGCLRLLDHIDWELMRRHPKLLIGFSDVTLLLQGLINRANQVAIHGPVVTSFAGSSNQDALTLFALLTGTLPERIPMPKLEILRNNTGKGRLIGGNLATLTHSLGTPWDYSWDGCILVLEDTNEPMYRLDRMLTQLALAGKLQRLAGLLLGDFDLSGGDSPADWRLQEEVWQRALDLAGPHYPIWANAPIGHGNRNQALPLGMEAVMDSASGALVLINGSVVRM